MADIEMTAMYAAYVECALWSTHDWPGDDGDPEPFDSWADESDLADATREAMKADCEAFARDHYCFDDVRERWTPEQFGHDFWLTRNGHGAGFWDRGHGEIGRRLTDAAKVYGEVDLYTGDDGKVYQQ